MNRRITLVSRPTGFPQESDFALEEAEIEEPGAGEVLVRARWVSLDPYQRGRMSEARSYAAPLEVGDVITSQTLGEVMQSNDPRFEPGDLVAGQFGRQEYAVARAGTLRKIPPGETRRYADIAAAIGSPKAVRAVGSANGDNHVCVLIPCHRVIRSDGTLGGYGGGIERKKKLLEAEGHPVAAPELPLVE